MSSKAFLALTLGFALSAIVSRAAQFSGPILDPANGHSYYLTTQDSWTGAQATAASLGGSLVTINDAAENQWVFDTFSSFGGVNRLLWLGLYDQAQSDPTLSNSYLWVDRENSPYRNWSAGEPNAWTPDEFYVYMYPNGYDGVDNVRTPGAWNNYKNSATEFGPGSPWPDTPIYGVVEVVPEPSVATIVGLGCLTFMRRRRNMTA